MYSFEKEIDYEEDSELQSKATLSELSDLPPLSNGFLAVVTA